MAAAAGMLLVALPVLAFAPPAAASHRRCRIHCPIPFQWDDEPPFASDNPPLPQGFVLTVPVRPDHPADPRRAAATLNRYADVAMALGACWDPRPAVVDQRWGDITLRVSFKRNGDVNGIPRIVHVAEAADQTTASGLRTSLLSALSHCTPLRLSASLGNAIAGQIFAIRFVQQGNT